jgi:hypothetical protein
MLFRDDGPNGVKLRALQTKLRILVIGLLVLSLERQAYNKH